MNMPLTNRSKALLDKESALLICSQHQAAFDINNGRCVSGPCPGTSLKNIDLIEVDKQLFLHQASH